MEEEQLITGSISRLSNVEPTPPTISNLNRQVFDKTSFLDTVDTSFSELGIEEVDPSFFDVDLATIDNFFELYDKFFFEIPKFGVNNSHEYLVIESSNYIDFNQNQEEIQALLNEITELRTENLGLIQSNSELQIKLAQSSNQPSTGSVTITPPPPRTGTGGTGTGGTGTGGTGTGGVGGKIICNELYRQGYLEERLWDADERYGAMMFKTRPKAIIGYQMWAKYVVRYMRNNPQNTKYLYKIIKPWTEYMGYEMGVCDKQNYIGKTMHLMAEIPTWLIYHLFGGKKILDYIKSRSNKI
jgi:hypothetical protein